MAVLITFEGLDGSGTTTQQQRVAERLRMVGLTVHTTREPSDGVIGKQIRSILAGELRVPKDALALLFAADRLEHVHQEIEPALAALDIVLSDRYLLSSLAYQGQELPLEWVQQINSRARHADITVFFDIDPAVAANRRLSRGGEEELFEAEQTQRRVDEAYRRCLELDVHGQVRRVDASGDIDTVTDAIMAHLAETLPQEMTIGFAP